MSFAEVRLESTLITYGAVGGSMYSTDVVTVNSGFEFRNKNWSSSRGRWEYGERKVPSAELHSIEGFFRARGGRFQGFRYKNRADYKATHTPLTELDIVTQGVFVNTSTTTAQMTKSYTSGVDTDFRSIRKPVASTVKVYKDGTLLTLTTDYTIDSTTGIVTFVVPFGSSALTWDGEFDTPVRFDADEFKARLDSGMPTVTTPPDLSETYWYLLSLPLVEIRV